MACPSFRLAETAADLKKSRISGGKQPFHAEFRRSLQVLEATGDGIDVRFRSRGWYQNGRIHLQIVPFPEKPAYAVKNFRPEPQGLPFSGQPPAFIIAGIFPGEFFWDRSVREGLQKKASAMSGYQPLTRVRYSPVRVSTRIFSPSSIKGGTMI